MKKYDCSKTLDYIHELRRMCKEYTNSSCEGCPFRNMDCTFVLDITQEHIAIIQRWSDEHPEKPKLTKTDMTFMEEMCDVNNSKAWGIERSIRLYATCVGAGKIPIKPSMFQAVDVGTSMTFEELLQLEVEDE